MVNLIFTCLIWLIFSIILFSNRKSKVNQSCFLSGILFSLGVLKEFFLYDVGPILLEHTRLQLGTLLVIYSILTSVLYLGAMPSSLLFSLYYNGVDEESPRIFRRVIIGLATLILVMMCVFPPWKTSHFQQTSLAFWITMTVFNLSLGAIMSWQLITGVLGAKSPRLRQQKRIVCFILLPPIWFWLITIFVIHTLGIQPLFKLWQGNAVLLAVILVFYIVFAFREGVMGLKLNFENYQWDSSVSTVGRSAEFIGHTLKNEIVKIEWCTKNLNKQFEQGEVPTELGIIHNSTKQLRYFIERNRRYSGDIQLQCERVEMAPFLHQFQQEARASGLETEIEVLCAGDATLYCDPQHIHEVVSNLLWNAADASTNNPFVVLAFTTGNRIKGHRGLWHRLAVTDQGTGIASGDIPKLFDPYYTTKNSAEHIGMGLFYCARVMEGHGGFIGVESAEGEGTTFSLCFPMGRELEK